MKNIRLRLALLLTVVCFSLSSCSKEDNVEPVILDNDYLEFEAQGGTQSITFTVNGGDWIAWVKPSEKADWYSYTPSNGSAGKHTLSVTVEPNRGDIRFVTIEINSNGNYKELYVVQQGNY